LKRVTVYGQLKGSPLRSGLVLQKCNFIQMDIFLLQIVPTQMSYDYDFMLQWLVILFEYFIFPNVFRIIFNVFSRLFFIVDDNKWLDLQTSGNRQSLV